MKMKKMLPVVVAFMMVLGVMTAFPLTAHAAEIMVGTNPDGEMLVVKSEEELLQLYRIAQTFDPVYYAAENADVKAVYGYADYALYYHYFTFGRSEGRKPCQNSSGGEFARWKMTPMEAKIKMQSAETGASESNLWKQTYPDNNIPWYYRQSEIDARLTANAKPDTETTDIVAIKDLPNYSSLKKRMTDAEFQAAYNEALKIVQPLAGLSKEEQAKGIFTALRAMADNGTVSYSEKASHYNDAYGYLINHVASCAGSTRTTGLCLNMLGMGYEHVNENQWSHQWCRVNINGVMWIVDPYGCVCAPESTPYAHPLLSEGTAKSVGNSDNVNYSLTPPTTEEEKSAFGWSLMAEGTLNLYQDAKKNGRYFDPEYYAANNPDVAKAFGDEPWIYYYHYLKYGIDEGRLPYKGGTAGSKGRANWELSYTEVVIKMLARQDHISEEEEWKRSYGGNIPWYATNAGIEAEIARRAGNS